MNNQNGKLLERALLKNPWHSLEIGGLPVNQSPLLSSCTMLVHAFTTRRGGKTPAPLDSFNLGRHIDSDEAKADASLNRKKLCTALGISFDKLVVPGQVHSATVALAERSPAFDRVDAVATATIGLPLLLHFADCVPIIVYETRRHALCIVHAGWKGTAQAIARNAVRTMVDEFGCRPEHMLAAVGPAIGSCCYPTGVDVAQKLAATVSSADQLTACHEAQPHPDLKAINALQLLEAGVSEVDVTSICTACDPSNFYSHRQSGGKTGRQGAIASLG